MSTDPTSKATYPQTGGSKLEHHDLPSHTARSLTMTIGASTSSSDGGAANIGPSDTQTLPEAATSAKAIKMAIHPTDTPLNPIARPFVPRNSIEPPLPPNPQTTAQAKPNSCDPQEPSWNGAFVSGCLEDPSAKWNVARRASQVVCSPSFSEKDLGLLTRKFCRRAHIQETGRGSESLAMFAAEVHRTVNVFYGAHQAFLFRQKMATYAVSTFVDKWDVKIPKAAVALFPKPVPLFFVKTTMSLLDFIGELHVHGIIEGHHTFACLRVMHSRGGCWRPDGENRDILEVKTSLGTFLDASSKVTDDMSFTGTSYAPSNKKRWINETEQLATSSGLNYD